MDIDLFWMDQVRVDLMQSRILVVSGTDGTPWTHSSKVHIFRSASIIWGAVGPARFFSGKYQYLYWGFALGVAIPFIPWLLHKRLERVKKTILHDSVFSKTVVPIILHGAIAPPATPTNVRIHAF